MQKRVSVTILILLLLVAVSFYFYFFSQEENTKVGRSKEVKEKEERGEEGRTIEEIAYELKGSPYELGPLGEGSGEEIIRKDAFDCTSFVLTVVAMKTANGEDPKEKMKEINYRSPEEISYENRLHFSTDRNRVSEHFNDITEEVGGDLTEKEEVILNKYIPGEGRLIDIEWEKRAEVSYILVEDISLLIENVPEKVGVGFVEEDSFDRGLDVVHEGFLFEGERLVHASEEKGEVVEDNFLKYLSGKGHDGVLFYEIED